MLSPISRLSIKKKVLASFVVFAVILAIFIFYVNSQLTLIDRSSSELSQHYDQLQSVLALEVDSQNLSNLVRLYLLNQDPKDQSAYNQTSIDLNNTLETLNTDHLISSEAKAINDYQTTSNLLEGTELLILADVKDGSIDNARNLFNINYELQQAHATSLISSIVTTESSTVSSLFSQNREEVDSIQLNLVLSLSIILLIVGMYLSLFSLDIANAIRKLSNTARSFAGGNFNARVSIPSHSRDELGQLGVVFNDMAVKLNETLRREALRTDELSKEKARFLSSIDSLPLGFIITDTDNRILNMNPAMQQMLGIKKTKTDFQIDDLFKNTDKFLGQLLTHSQTALKDQHQINIHEISNKGKLFRAFFSPVLVTTDQAQHSIGAVILVEDVTEERVMARSKDEFFSIASHELRTPLTAIRGNTGLIQQFFKRQLKDKQLNEMVGDIHESSVRLIEIVNDFLDASRLEQGKMQFNSEEFAMENVIEKVVYEIAGVAREKKIDVRMTNDLNTLPHVFADINKVKQILYNLVGNALKFVEAGSITIEAKVADKFLKVYVIDTGKGISDKNQQILFHKFQQANTSILTRDTTRGTGLGLYISRLLAEKMGGGVALEHSEEGKGSTFSFTIPLAPSKTDISPTTSKEGKP